MSVTNVQSAARLRAALARITRLGFSVCAISERERPDGGVALTLESPRSVNLADIVEELRLLGVEAV